MIEQLRKLRVASIANNPDYDSLSDTSKTMDYGAPTLAADGLVVAGQARLAGLSRAYGQGTATAYRQSLEQDAARLGLDPERVRGMQKPVLVRRVSATALPATQHPIEASARSTKGLPQTDQADFATQAEQPKRHDDPRTDTGERAPAKGAGQLADGQATSDAGVEATAGQVRLNQNGKPLPKRRAERLEKKEAKGQAKQETDFVPAPGGGLDYGEITPDMGKAMRRQAGKIRLRVGNAKWGLTHINARHLADFKALGFASAQDFVAQVTEGFSAIYKGKGVALDVVLSSERHGLLIVSLAPSAEGDFYDVKTATPTRSDQFKNQSPLWDRTGPSASGSTNAAPSFPKGQSGAGSVAKAEPSRKPAPYTDKSDKEALLKTDKALVGKAGRLNLAGRKLLRTPWEGMDAGERGRLLQLAEARTPAKGQEQAPKKTPQVLDFDKRSNAQLAEEYERLEGTDGGHSIDADEARELSAAYRAERSRAADIHAATSRLVQYLYRRALARPVAKGRDNAVLFLAGGGGSGKSTVRKNVFGGNTADITLDGTFSDLKKARANIAAALATGREVVIIFVYRPVGLAAKNVIDRALRSGRSVPIEALVKAHVNVKDTPAKTWESLV